VITVDHCQEIGRDRFLGLDLVGETPRKTFVRASQISMVTPLAEGRLEVFLVGCEIPIYVKQTITEILQHL
jgi:hypothetical protein